MTDTIADSPAATPYAPSEFEQRTWRYLRLAMIALAVGLGAAVFFEAGAQSHVCFQKSISAYYYTPAQSVLVGVLIAIGVCLLCVKGDGAPWEDLFLNIAGMLAPVVALVPTSPPPPVGFCGVIYTGTDRGLNVTDNVGALIVVGGAAILLPILNPVLRKRRGKEPVARPLGVIVTWAAAMAFWLCALFLYVFDVTLIERFGHPVAAIGLFLGVFGYVVANARGWRKDRKAPGGFNWYAWIAGAMLAFALAGLALLLAGWSYWLLFLETSLLVCFAVFWAVQTFDLWERGRPPLLPSAVRTHRPAER